MSEMVPDEVIARAVQTGDREQFGIIVERYEQKLLRYGRKFLSGREDVEDIVQDAFLRAYQNIQSYDSSRPFSAWIYRIAHNAFVNRLRKNAYGPILVADFDTFIAHPQYEDPTLTERDHADIKSAVDAGLSELVSQYREVLILYYLEELSYKEIAEILQIPIGTVGIRLSRARTALKKVLPDHAVSLI